MEIIISHSNFIKRTFAWTLVVIAFFLFASTASADTLFSDGFESGDFTAWDGVGFQWSTISSAGAHTGTERAHAEGPSLGSVLTKGVSTIGYENITVSFWYKVAGLEAGDEVEVDYSDDGGATWDDDIVIFTDGVGDDVSDWTEFSAVLPVNADDNADFVLRFRLATNAVADDFDLDDVLLTGDLIVVDEDDDGVLNSDDLCPNTEEDEFPDWGKSKGRYMWDGAEWISSGKGDKKFEPSMDYTHGCSGEQILDSMSETLGEDFGGHYKHGLSKSILQEWHEGVYYVGPTFIETVEVPGTSPASVMSIASLTTDADYFLNAYGTYRFANWGEYGIADAEWAYRDAPHAPGGIAGWVKGEGYYASPCGLDIQVDGSCVDWGGLSDPAHEYSIDYVGTGAPVSFSIHDSAYGDNSGSLFVDIIEDKWVDLW